MEKFNYNCIFVDLGKMTMSLIEGEVVYVTYKGSSIEWLNKVYEMRHMYI